MNALALILFHLIFFSLMDFSLTDLNMTDAHLTFSADAAATQSTHLWNNPGGGCLEGDDQELHCSASPLPKVSLQHTECQHNANH